MKSSVFASGGPKLTASKIKVSDIPEIKFGSVPKAIGSQPNIPQMSRLNVPSIPDREESGLGEQPLFQAPKIGGPSSSRGTPTVSKSISKGRSGQNTTKMIKNLQRSFKSLRSRVDRLNRLQRKGNRNQRIQNQTINSLQKSQESIIENQNIQKDSTTSIIELRETTNNIIQSQSEIKDSLQETTTILNDIGNAMSLDFADRITKEREAIQKTRKKKRDAKRDAAEKSVEGSSTLEKAGKGIVASVKKPVMGLMSKIGSLLTFLTLGLIASPALKWLRNNGKAIDAFFGFFTRHWVSILGFGIGAGTYQTAKNLGRGWKNMGSKHWLRKGLRGVRNKLFGPKVTQTGTRAISEVTDAAFGIKPKTIAQFTRKKSGIGKLLQRSNIVAKKARRLPVGKIGGGLLSVLFAGMEFKGRKEEGQTTGKALIGTAGSTLGGIGGAKAGALAGAAIGSIIPGAGTAVGAVLGGLIGGIAGSTPPVIGWAASVEGLSISNQSLKASLESVIDLGSPIPWFMFILIFLWTPPHFWALALYRSEEYGEVGIPMLPNVKGPERTIIEMKVYSILLILLSLIAPVSFGEIEVNDRGYHALRWTILGLSVWYASTVWRIDISEEPDETGRISSAASSFLVSMIYLALMFVVLVTGSFGQIGTAVGAVIAIAFIGRSVFKVSA